MSTKIDFIKKFNVSLRAGAGAPAVVRRARPSANADENITFEAKVAPPELKPFVDMDFWYLTAPLEWRWEKTSGRPDVVVPAGFTTDFASVPSIFWSSVPPTGRYGIPAILHDWLYWEQAGTREQADTIFWDAMTELGVGYPKRYAIWSAVHWFGGSYWDGNTKAKTSGTARILKRYPDDARISWDDWRQRPGVFG